METSAILVCCSPAARRPHAPLRLWPRAARAPPRCRRFPAHTGRPTTPPFSVRHFLQEAGAWCGRLPPPPKNSVRDCRSHTHRESAVAGYESCICHVGPPPYDRRRRHCRGRSAGAAAQLCRCRCQSPQRLARGRSGSGHPRLVWVGRGDEAGEEEESPSTVGSPPPPPPLSRTAPPPARGPDVTLVVARQDGNMYAGDLSPPPQPHGPRRRAHFSFPVAGSRPPPRRHRLSGPSVPTRSCSACARGWPAGSLPSAGGFKSLPSALSRSVHARARSVW